MSLTLIYVKADELLYTLPVLELSRAVAGILTWLSEGALCFSHFLIHSSQTQPRAKQRKQRGRDLASFLLLTGRKEGPCGTYKVTMSALAAWTAILSGSCPSLSTACWFAPRLRNKQTWLQKGTKGHQQKSQLHVGVGTEHSPPTGSHSSPCLGRFPSELLFGMEIHPKTSSPSHPMTLWQL